MTEYGILAANDGSSSGAEALCWAAREAHDRRTRLTVFVASDLAPPGPVPPHEAVRRAARRGERLLADGLGYAESVVGLPALRVEVTDEPPAQALCRHSKDAEITVLGAHGHSALPGMLLGSVPLHVAAHGHGRIVVVRGSWKTANAPAGPIVAGVDGSSASQQALTLAFEEAALRRVPVEAVCALADAPGTLGEARKIEEEFDHEITCQEKAHQDVTVTRRVDAGSPRTSLLTASSGAQLVVVGARGRGGFRNLVLGSVAEAMLYYSPCPVAIVQPA